MACRPSYLLNCGLYYNYLITYAIPIISLIFQCFANLARWEDLEKCSVENIDDKHPPDLDKMWTDTFFQVRFGQNCSKLVSHPACL